MDSYDSYEKALRMLENSEPLKFEVFTTYSRMIKEGALEDLKPDEVMANAMNEWDL